MIPKYRSGLIVDPVFESMGEVGPAGPPGPAGLPGRDAVDGRDGADARGWIYVGEWSAKRQYTEGQVTTASGSSFVCLKDHTDREPPNSRFWGVVAARGARGETGERGGTGARGMPSPTPSAGNTATGIFDSAAVRGNVVRVSGTNRVDLALAHGSDAPGLAIGLSNGAYGPNEKGSYTTSGPFTNEAWNFTPGECLYLSPTVPGGLTNVFPDTFDDRVIILGMMLTPTTINLKIHWAAIIGS